MKFKYCNCFLEYRTFQYDLTEYKFICCNKNNQQKFDEMLKERFLNRYKYSNMIRKVYFIIAKRCFQIYEYMDDWEKFNETSLPEKEDFYSHLNMENITDAHYVHAKRSCKNFEIKN